MKKMQKPATCWRNNLAKGTFPMSRLLLGNPRDWLGGSMSTQIVRYSCDEHGADLMNYQIDPATYDMVSEPPCPKCGKPMTTKVLIGDTK